MEVRMGMRWFAALITDDGSRLDALARALCADVASCATTATRLSLLAQPAARHERRLWSFEIEPRVTWQAPAELARAVRAFPLLEGDEARLAWFLDLCLHGMPEFSVAWSASKIAGRAFYAGRYEAMGYSAFATFEAGRLTQGAVELGAEGPYRLDLSPAGIALRTVADDEREADDAPDPAFDGVEAAFGGDAFELLDELEHEYRVEYVLRAGGKPRQVPKRIERGTPPWPRASAPPSRPGATKRTTTRRPKTAPTAKSAGAKRKHRRKQT